MKQFNLSIEKYRNIGIMAHIDAGKTTVSERILFYSGRVHNPGDIDKGTTVLDDDPLEQNKGITINSAATTVYWNNGQGIHRINLIDTPGHIDFTVEVERALRVLDGAVCVLDASQGVEPQTEQVWRQADKYNVARIVFVNKMDKAGADYQMSLSSLKEKLGIKAIPIQIPSGEEDKFNSIIDIIDMKLIKFDDQSLGKSFNISDIPEELIALARAARDQMIESLADIDDTICEKFLSGDLFSISNTEIRAALRAGTISRKICPVLCGSALRNKGVQMLLDAILYYLPAPSDLEYIKGIHPKTQEDVIRKLNDNDPFTALAFKVVTDKNGDLTFLRIYSGSLRAGSKVYNASRDKSDRVSRVLLVHASDKEDIEYATSGTIVAVVGLKNVFTGDTICDQNKPILLEKMEFPEPVVELLVEPKTNADQDKLSLALQKMLVADPSLKVSIDEDTAQTILRGMGELHLEIIVERLRNNYNVNVNTGKPKVSYRETIVSTGFADTKYVRQSGGRGQYGHVVMTINPAPRGSGLVFRSDIIGGSIPKEYIPAIEKGVKGAMGKGVIAGYPVVDVEVIITDGSYHAVDSSANAFEIAGSMAFQQAAKNAGLVILEPIMSLEVSTPETYMGDVIGTISARSGRIKNTSSKGNSRVIEADIPLRTVFGYTTELRGRTQGRASPSMRFSHYEVCSLKPSELK